MSFEIVATDYFERELKPLAKKYRSLGADLSNLLAELQLTPRAGNPLGRDCYKVRMAIASKGKGKSGGARVIICLRIVDEEIHLLSIYDKSDQDTISVERRDELLNDAGLI